MPAVTWEFLKRNLTKINLAEKFCLDLIFPKFCFDCGKEGSWLCRACQKKIILVKTQVCPGCGRVSRQGKFCSKCKGKDLAGIMVACYFEEGPIRELVHNFKYNHILELGDFLGQILADATLENLTLKKDFLVVPVPLHWLRRSRRGYNQAEILVKVMSEKLSLPFDQVLRRTRRTKRQVDLRGSERRENLKNVFEFFPGKNIDGKTIILVDDITTTSTTLLECALVLRENGAKKVWGLVIAKG
ncbi:MAG: ComF family protein [Patescibacteria group bacterium]|nr:ComF family protein [Patescibacteria group bacterium]